jgi:signal transduction histidine kinase
MTRGMIETGRRRELWLALLVLAAAVLVPTAFVLWFMAAAMRNERAAVRQQLTDTYREQALSAWRKIEEHWIARRGELSIAGGLPAPAAFAACIPLADSVIVCDGMKDMLVLYPTCDVPQEPLDDLGPDWAAAARLEHELKQPEQAAASYARAVERSKEPRIRALALLAQARCMARAGHKAEASALLATLIRTEQYQSAHDLSGRLIVPNAMLLALEWTDASAREHAALAKELAERLMDYTGLEMASSQRLFLMESLPPETRTPRYVAAEKLAAQYVETQQPASSAALLMPTRVPGIWQFTRPIGTVGAAGHPLIALYREQRIVQESEEAIGPDLTKKWTRLSFAPPGVAQPPSAVTSAQAGAPVPHSPSTEEPFLSIPAPDPTWSGWTLNLSLRGPDPFAEAARRQHGLYLWTGAVGILFISVLALAITLYLARQMRLTRLKNDLIATVSHELKTPLSSMRVLVDTLLEGRCAGPEQEREYLRLIAGENQRLTRLIDNFLNFSRMERNRHAFEFAEVKPDEVVRAAAESVRERFTAPHCRLEVDAPPDLPPIIADRDALVTVLLNLLDNAWKYSGEVKEVSVRARFVVAPSLAGQACRGLTAGAKVCPDGHTTSGELVLTVQDNGIGLSRRQIRRIFQPFYQADRSLSRRAGGCGLGLSIVRFIVRAHGGRVEVASEPGKGSVFTVRLPVNGPTAA